MKSYPCPDCEATFKTSPARSIHKAAVHLKIRHKCDGCDYSHHSKQVVKKHFSAQHSNAIFSCPHCSFTSNWLAELQKHSRGQVLESNCLSITNWKLVSGLKWNTMWSPPSISGKELLGRDQTSCAILSRALKTCKRGICFHNSALPFGRDTSPYVVDSCL